MTRLARGLPRLRPLLAPAGGLLLFLGERVVSGGAATTLLDWAGVILLAGSLLWGLAALRRREERAVWRLLTAPPALFLAAAALYYAAAALSARPAGAVDWAGLATAAWMLLLLIGAVLFAFLELAVLAQTHTPRHDVRRLRLAASGGLSLGLLAALVATLNFNFNALPWQWDLAYFKTTRPSPVTRELVQGLIDPVDVGVFFSTDSVVGSLVRDYFAALAGDGPAGRLRSHLLDADLAPGEAEAYRARGNGWVVLRKGEVLAPINLGETLERARPQLRKFDQTFHRKLLEIARRKQVAYLTVGHGERNERTAAPRRAERGFSRFQALLRARNFEVKALGLSEGLGEEVPADADLVVVAGPTEPFLPSELESLGRHLERGGRLMVFLEPVPERRSVAAPPAGKKAPATLLDLLGRYGIAYDPVLQANDRFYGRRTYTRADHALLVTIRYQDHPSLSLLRRRANQYPLVLLGAGALRGGQAPAGLTVQEIIKGMGGTWGDTNRNFRFDAGTEQRGEPALAVAVAPKTPGRKKATPRKSGGKTNGPTILAFADADLAADLLLQNRANRLLVEQALAWLAGREPTAGLPASEEDVRIRHAKGDDWLWFYLPVIGVPALVLLLGFLRMTRLGRRSGGSDE